MQRGRKNKQPVCLLYFHTKGVRERMRRFCSALVSPFQAKIVIWPVAGVIGRPPTTSSIFGYCGEVIVLARAGNGAEVRRTHVGRAFRGGGRFDAFATGREQNAQKMGKLAPVLAPRDPKTARNAQ